MAYSIDFRKRAIEFMNEGHTLAELYEAFRIAQSTIDRWRKLLKETDSLKPQYRERRKRKIDLTKLEQAVERKPDATLSELAELFDCRPQSVAAALKKIEITRKKRHFHTANRTYQT